MALNRTLEPAREGVILVVVPPVEVGGGKVHVDAVRGRGRVDLGAEVLDKIAYQVDLSVELVPSRSSRSTT